MSQVKIQGNASGTGALTIAAPNTNSNYTLTLPAATTTFVGTDATQTLTNKTLSTGFVMGASTVTSGTAAASTSGTSIDFTSIPSWVKRITVMFTGVSTSGTSIPLIRLGTSGGVVATGYAAGASYASTATTYYQDTTGFPTQPNTSASDLKYGAITFLNLSGNTWVSQGCIYLTSQIGDVAASAGAITLGGTLDRIRITTVNGTDTFDAGSINILYE